MLAAHTLVVLYKPTLNVSVLNFRSLSPTLKKVKLRPFPLYTFSLSLHCPSHLLQFYFSFLALITPCFEFHAGHGTATCQRSACHRVRSFAGFQDLRE